VVPSSHHPPHQALKSPRLRIRALRAFRREIKQAMHTGTTRDST
jgi:hypothetical protein